MSVRAWIAGIALVAAGCTTAPQEPQAPPKESGPAPPAEAPKEAPEAMARIEPQVAPPAEPPRRVDDVERLLTYFEQIRKLAPGEFAREAEHARASFGRTRSDFDRMRYGVLLSVPNTPLNDDQRALELLETLAKNPASALHGLALLVSAHLQERRRLESGMQTLQQNVQGLQQKLDALMSLERSLMNRKGEPPPPRKR